MKIFPTVLLAALAGWSSLAQAQSDLPAAVGRISAVQGQVTLTGEDEPVAASLNWPVTANSHLSTATGGRTEFRLGSTAVRLDGDSDLEITAMDDDLLRLRLNYGSVSIRVRNAELLRDFELTTPQARITLIEPGLLRVDVERVADTSQISVLTGTARVDGAGSSVTVNAGRHVDVSSEDVRTSVARRDGFDVWADERDRQAEAVVTTQYVSTGMTGYEELDRNGSWTDNVEYGPLWAPRNVAADWAPYRDGRWTWLAPWGWTWVDNAPWGYAPSHYGRWVTVRQRWYWAPGRPAGRHVWAPALVGWVGGVNHPNHGPGLGWYPLTPRDRFVPNYRVSSSYEQRLGWTYKGKPFTPRPGMPGNKDRDRRDGLTVLPRNQFEGRQTVRVNRGDHFIPRPQQANLATPVAPPRPTIPGRIETNRNQDRDGNGRPDRFERNDNNSRNDGVRNDNRPGRVISTGPAQAQQQQQGGPRGQGRPQTIGTLPPNQVGTPDAPAQTINPRDVGIELHTRPNGARPGAGAVSPAPVLQVGPTRDRFQRDDDRRPADRDEQRQRWQDRPQQRPQQAQPQAAQPQPAQPQPVQPPQRPQQAQPQQPVAQPSQPAAQSQRPQPQQQQQQQPQQPQQQQDRPRWGGERPQSQERPQPQERPQSQPQRPQERPPQQERPQPRPERPQQQERPQPQAQPAPRPAPQPAAQPQPRQDAGQGRQHRDRPGQE